VAQGWTYGGRGQIDLAADPLLGWVRLTEDGWINVRRRLRLRSRCRTWANAGAVLGVRASVLTSRAVARLAA
jgi:hypothetical protein